MKPEEAIKRIENLIKGREDPRGKTELDFALDMAIEALKETERNPTITSWYDFDRGYEKGKASTRQHGECKTCKHFVKGGLDGKTYVCEHPNIEQDDYYNYACLIMEENDFCSSYEKKDGD